VSCSPCTPPPDEATRLVYLEDVVEGMVIEIARRTQTDVLIFGGTPGPRWGQVLERRERGGTISLRLQDEATAEQVGLYGTEIQLVRERLDVRVASVDLGRTP
jgi:hypothetical protein